jgi:hypothetical protein
LWIISVCVDVEAAAAGIANPVKDSEGGKKPGTAWDQLGRCKCCVAVLLVLARRGEAGVRRTCWSSELDGLLLALAIVPVLTVAFPLALVFQVEFAVGHTARIEMYVLRFGCCC